MVFPLKGSNEDNNIIFKFIEAPWIVLSHFFNFKIQDVHFRAISFDQVFGKWDQITKT